MKMIQALWHTSPLTSEIITATLPTRLSNTLEIESYFSLVSAGTETLVATGAVPTALHAAMQVPYMDGDFNLPIKYAYSLVGKVVTEDHEWSGKMVHFMHPHQDRTQVAIDDLTLIPDLVPARRACLASNLETAVNAVWDAQVMVGDRVLLVGFGLIGSLVARIVAAIPGVDLWILERDAQRIALAQQLGFSQVVSQIDQSNFDLAFNASTAAAGLQKAIDVVGLEGKVIELSWYGQNKVELQLGAAFHYQRKKIISSQVGQIPSTHRARWDYRRRKQLVFELLKDEKYDLHLSHDIAFAATPELFDRLRKGDRSALAWCINY